MIHNDILEIYDNDQTFTKKNVSIDGKEFSPKIEDDGNLKKNNSCIC